MRQIEKMMVNAVNSKKNFKQSNTEVEIIKNNVFVRLHGNIIFADVNNKKYFSTQGWNTVTTGSRLRALGADFSTNSKRNRCELTQGSKMNSLYIDALFGWN